MSGVKKVPDRRRVVHVAARLLAAALVAVTGCGYLPGWSAPYRSPWVLGDVDADRVVVVVSHGVECERVDRVEVVEQTPERVKIEAYIQERTGERLCPDMGVDTWAPLTLDAPLGDRQLIGCTYDIDGVEPDDVDCRHWPFEPPTRPFQ